MSEPAQKWEIYAIFKQNYIKELFYSFKIAHYCYFSYGEI